MFVDVGHGGGLEQHGRPSLPHGGPPPSLGGVMAPHMGGVPGLQLLPSVQMLPLQHGSPKMPQWQMLEPLHTSVIRLHIATGQHIWF